MLSDTERLQAIEEIKQLKARYFRCFDTKDLAGFLGVFTLDVVLDASQSFCAWDYVMGCWVRNGIAIANGTEPPETMIMNGHRAVQEGFDMMAGVSSVHHGHMPEIVINSDNTVTGVWAMEDRLSWKEGSFAALTPFTQLNGYGHYHDAYQKGDDNRWRISRTRLARTRVDMS